MLALLCCLLDAFCTLHRFPWPLIPAGCRQRSLSLIPAALRKKCVTKTTARVVKRSRRKNRVTLGGMHTHHFGVGWGSVQMQAAKMDESQQIVRGEREDALANGGDEGGWVVRSCYSAGELGWPASQQGPRGTLYAIQSKFQIPPALSHQLDKRRQRPRHSHSSDTTRPEQPPVRRSVTRADAVGFKLGSRVPGRPDERRRRHIVHQNGAGADHQREREEQDRAAPRLCHDPVDGHLPGEAGAQGEDRQGGPVARQNVAPVGGGVLGAELRARAWVVEPSARRETQPSASPSAIQVRDACGCWQRAHPIK